MYTYREKEGGSKLLRKNLRGNSIHQDERYLIWNLWSESTHRVRKAKHLQQSNVLLLALFLLFRRSSISPEHHRQAFAAWKFLVRKSSINRCS